jgi:hypothetical protein
MNSNAVVATGWYQAAVHSNRTRETHTVVDTGFRPTYGFKRGHRLVLRRKRGGIGLQQQNHKREMRI